MRSLVLYAVKRPGDQRNRPASIAERRSSCCGTPFRQAQGNITTATQRQEQNRINGSGRLSVFGDGRRRGEGPFCFAPGWCNPRSRAAPADRRPLFVASADIGAKRGRRPGDPASSCPGKAEGGGDAPRGGGGLALPHFRLTADTSLVATRKGLQVMEIADKDGCCLGRRICPELPNPCARQSDSAGRHRHSCAVEQSTALQAAVYPGPQLAAQRKADQHSVGAPCVGECRQAQPRRRCRLWRER